MALQECGLNIDRVNKELLPHGSIDFPCAGYRSYLTDRAETAIPWHWHDEMEAIYVEDGQAEIKTPSASFILEAGDMAVINSNVLHCGSSASYCTLDAIVFSPTLITGGSDTAFSRKYIRPLTSCCAFSGYKASKNDDPLPSECFVRAFDALEHDSRWYEFTVRESLSRICMFLYDKFEAHANENAEDSKDNLRIRKMLDFIHKHFSYDISLADIANSADISNRECLRCFKKTLQISPIQYLLKYRIMSGADMLLSDSSCSIAEISTHCGFDSPSNFAKTFKRFYNKTPREYRGC